MSGRQFLHQRRRPLSIVATQKVVNSEHLSGKPVRYKMQNVPLIEVPSMSLWRRRQDYSNAMIGGIVITLAQIGLTLAVVLLWFFH